MATKKILGTVLIATRDPKSTWVAEVAEVVRQHRLRPVCIGTTQEALRRRVGKHGGLTDPTRFLVHLGEVDGDVERGLHAVAGKVIFYAPPDYSTVLALPRVRSLREAIPHNTSCIGSDALNAELERVTTPGGGW